MELVCFLFQQKEFQATGFVVLALVMCLRRSTSGGALLVWFSLVLDLCALARIHPTRASLWWSSASFGPVVTRNGRAVLPCLVCGQHAPGSFLPGPAREGQEPLLRSQLVMIWAAGGCLLQGGFSE